MDRSADPFAGVFEIDGAMERLRRFPLADVMRSPAVVFEGAEQTALLEAAGRRRMAYVVARDGRLLGWIEVELLEKGIVAEEAVVRVDPAVVSVRHDGSALDAVVRMHELGTCEVCVVDGDHRLLGEVTLAAIEEWLLDET